MSFADGLQALARARSDLVSPFEPLAGGWLFACAPAHERSEVERFIAARFLRAYGARLRQFFPVLMSLRHHGSLVAACGLRRAGAEPLFLERYLDDPIDVVLSATTNKRVVPSAVVEVGNLAAARAGIARRLILELTLHLKKAGIRWAVFSAVPSLRNNFRRLGIPLIPLVPADPSRLVPGERAEWGTYYDVAPHVTVVRVAAAHTALTRKPCTR